MEGGQVHLRNSAVEGLKYHNMYLFIIIMYIYTQNEVLVFHEWGTVYMCLAIERTVTVEITVCPCFML